MAKAAGLSEQRLGRRSCFSLSAKIALMALKAYTGFSDRQLVEHLNGNIHYRMFCTKYGISTCNHQFCPQGKDCKGQAVKEGSQT